MGAIENSSSTADRRADAVEKLRILAEAEEPQPFAIEALTKTALNKELENEVRQQSRKALKEVARKRVQTQRKLIEALAQTLNNARTDPVVRQLAVAALQEVGIRPAAIE